jgi:hypothetical protein
MIMKQKANRNLWIALSLLVSAALACSLFTPAKKVTLSFPTGVPAITPISSLAAPTITVAPPGEATAISGTGNTNNATSNEITLTQGLDALTSYQATFGVTVTAKDANGKDINGSAQVIQETVNADKSKHSAITYNGIMGAGSTQSGAMDIYQVANTTYMVTSNNSAQAVCSMFPAGSSPLKGLLVDPNDVFGKIQNARLVEKDVMVNDVQSDHYAFDETNLTGSRFTKANGDVWVAQDSQYVVKLTGTAVGGNLFLITDPNANYTYNYTIDQAGKIAKITVPAECGGLPADIPMPPNATMEAGFAGAFSLKSSDTPANVADFFRTELPTQGWKAGDETTSGDTITMQFSKDARSVEIVIAKDASGSTIVVTTSQ